MTDLTGNGHAHVRLGANDELTNEAADLFGQVVGQLRAKHARRADLSDRRKQDGTFSADGKRVSESFLTLDIEKNPVADPQVTLG